MKILSQMTITMGWTRLKCSAGPLQSVASLARSLDNSRTLQSSLIPRKWDVWAYPLLHLQTGHAFVSASALENQAFTEVWHPTVFKQHLARMIGGANCALWQILDFKQSIRLLFKDGGKLPAFPRCMPAVLGYPCTLHWWCLALISYSRPILGVVAVAWFVCLPT